MNDYSFSVTPEFHDVVMEYVFSRGAYDTDNIFVLNFSDVAAVGHILGIEGVEYIEDDLDVIAEVADGPWLEYILGDEYEAVYRVRRGFYRTPEGVLMAY